MNSTSARILSSIAASLALLAGGAQAQSASAAPTTATAGASAELTEGEVRKVDKSTGKITLRHGEIKNLDMPPMTMVFNVSDPTMLDKVKAGDKVRFRVASQDGKFTVTEIQAAK